MREYLITVLIVSTLLLLASLFLIMRGYLKYFEAWLNNKSVWNPNYDRLRLFLNIFFFGLSYFIFHMTFREIETFYLSWFHKISFSTIPFALGLMTYFIKMSWSKKFEIKPLSASTTSIKKDQLENSKESILMKIEKKEKDNEDWMPKLKKVISNKKGKTKKPDKYLELYYSLKEKLMLSDCSEVYYLPSNVSLSDFHYSYYNRRFINNYIKKNIYLYYDKIFEKDKVTEYFKNSENVKRKEAPIDIAYNSIFFFIQEQINSIFLEIKSYTENRPFYNKFKPNNTILNELICKFFLENIIIANNSFYGIQFEIKEDYNLLFNAYFKEVLVSLWDDKHKLDTNSLQSEIKALKRVVIKNKKIDLDWYIKELTETITLNRLKPDPSPVLKPSNFDSHIPQAKEKLNITKKERNFNLKISENQIQKLYDSLIRYGIITLYKNSSEDFSNVLLKNWEDHNSCIYFTLDNPSIREFYELLKKEFASSSFKLIHFIDTSNLIKKEDGEKYNYDSVKNAKQRTIESKKSEILNKIFSSL